MKRLAGNPGKRPLTKPELVTKDNAPEIAAALAEVDASPSARGLALEHQLSLADIPGTGAGGRVLKSDVERALAAKGKIGLEPPKDLTKAGKAVWKDTAPMLQRLGVLSQLNALLFAQLCDIQGRIRGYKVLLEKEGEFYRTTTGQIKRHPAKSSLQSDEREARHLAAAFGITPSATGRVAESMSTLPLFKDRDPERDQKNPLPEGAGENVDKYFGY